MLNANDKLFRAFVCLPKKTQNLLKVFAFFANEDISALFVMHAISLKLGLTNSMLHCLRQRIFSVKGVGLHMPPELQEHLRDTLSFADSSKYLAHALKALYTDFPPNLADRPERWEYFKRLVPHVLSVCNYADQFDLPANDIANLLSQVALLLYLTEQYPRAEQIIRKLLQMAQIQPDQPNPFAAYWLKVLASVYEKTGRPEQAIPLLKQADKIDKASEK